jgi:prepilin-type N-terminal cleavage/methylation domain-containing protein
MSNPRNRLTARLGFTLMELVVTTAVIAVVLVTLGSAIVMTSRAMPSAASPGGEVDYRRAAAIDQMCAELRCATGFSEMTPTAVTFTVADRNSDGNPETIRYAWGGTAGSGLTRSYNAATAASVADNLATFSLAYLKDKHTTSTTGTTTWDSGEVQLASFSGWSGITNGLATTPLSTTTWASESFTINAISLPADTTRLAISRISLKMKKPTSGTAGATVGIYAPSAAGASTPGSSVFGSVYTIPAANLTTSIAWVDATFSDVVFGDAKTKDFVILVKGIAASSATLQYYSASTAPTDSTVYRYTSNSGSTWFPTSNLNQFDAPFVVYGSYQRQVTASVSADTYTMASVTVSLQSADVRPQKLDSAVTTLNQPTVTGP